VVVQKEGVLKQVKQGILLQQILLKEIQVVLELQEVSLDIEVPVVVEQLQQVYQVQQVVMEAQEHLTQF
tara:strand:+ start:36 stop:242 length:207 start_codon:yes stop_codon:yes gene_type:complete